MGSALRSSYEVGGSATALELKVKTNAIMIKSYEYYTVLVYLITCNHSYINDFYSTAANLFIPKRCEEMLIPLVLSVIMNKSLNGTSN